MRESYPLFSLLIEITKKCNAACDQCGSRCDIHSEELLTGDQNLSALRDVRDHLGADTMLNISGGAFFNPAEAEIHADGVLVGNGGAPILLPAGKHTIEVKANGYKPAAVTVNVNSDQNININLEK